MIRIDFSMCSIPRRLYTHLSKLTVPRGFARCGKQMKSRQTLRVIAAGTIGNVLEWYDFAIYGYFATAIGRQFFPHEDPVAQLLSAFGVFALGYLMRPVGGALIGHIGDRFGRRAALTFSVAAMAVPTFLIGFAGILDTRAYGADRSHIAADGAGTVRRRRLYQFHLCP